MSRDTLESSVHNLVESAKVIARAKLIVFTGTAGGIYDADVRAALLSSENTQDTAAMIFSEFRSADALRSWLRSGQVKKTKAVV
jgi:hypothetical protein